VCYVMKNQKRIKPFITNDEMRQMMQYPLRLYDILRFSQMRMQNLVLWLIPHLPVLLFVLTVRLLGKTKRVL